MPLTWPENGLKGSNMLHILMGLLALIVFLLIENILTKD